MSSPVEPAAQQLIDDIAEGMAAGGMTVTEAFALSQAISLKRIADALHGDQFNTGIMRSMIDIAEQRRGH